VNFLLDYPEGLSNNGGFSTKKAHFQIQISRCEMAGSVQTSGKLEPSTFRIELYLMYMETDQPQAQKSRLKKIMPKGYYFHISGQ
jgi:hypothetical protein